MEDKRGTIPTVYTVLRSLRSSALVFTKGHPETKENCAPSMHVCHEPCLNTHADPMTMFVCLRMTYICGWFCRLKWRVYRASNRMSSIHDARVISRSHGSELLPMGPAMR